MTLSFKSSKFILESLLIPFSIRLYFVSISPRADIIEFIPSLKAFSSGISGFSFESNSLIKPRRLFIFSSRMSTIFLNSSSKETTSGLIDSIKSLTSPSILSCSNSTTLKLMFMMIFLRASIFTEKLLTTSFMSSRSVTSMSFSGEFAMRISNLATNFAISSKYREILLYFDSIFLFASLMNKGISSSPNDSS